MTQGFRDFLAGGLLAFVGFAAAYLCWQHYDIGTIRRMGSGMFPLGIGLILGLLGAIMALRALLRGDLGFGRPEVDLRSSFFVLGGLSAFALLVTSFGLIAALCGLVILTGQAGRERLTPLSTLIMCAVVCALCWVIFVKILGLNLPLIKVPKL